MRTTLTATAAALMGLASAQLQGGIYTKYPDCVNGPALLTSNLVCNPNASPHDRAVAIINAMTITEKLENLLDVANGSARLGLPPYEFWSEALHGVAGSPGANFNKNGTFSYATSFPMPITFSAAFDDDLVEEIATVISTEARAYSNAGRFGLNAFTPNINPYKDPRWGRGSETPGEDPLRISGYVKRLLIGLEGTDAGLFNTSHSGYKKMIATCKHFSGYDLETQPVRYGYDAKITSQDLAEYYMPPFEMCARQNVGSFMCSYNAVNGIPSCANAYFMKTILREHWGWTSDNNFITSDCNAVGQMVGNHNYTTTTAAAEGISLTAGMDSACIVANTGAGNIVDTQGAYYDGYATEEVITTALVRQYEALIIAGYFDSAASQPYRSIGWSVVDTPSSQQLAKTAATAGMTLLKNDGALPIALKGKKVALIGMWANGTTNLQGGYSGPAPYIHNAVYAAKALGLQYTYADGPTNQSVLSTNYSSAALAAASSADVILYFGGIDWSVEAEAMDRYQISWPQAQLDLLTQLSGLGKPVIVAQLGSMLDATPLLNNKAINALLWAGYPGQDGGVAAFEILTGVTAPAGRLPVTMYPADYVNQVPMSNMSLRSGPGNPGRTYKWYSGGVLPFAYGLHYTSFRASFAVSAPAPWNYGHHGWKKNYHGPTTCKQQGSYNIQDLLSGCDEAHPDLCPFPSAAISVRNTGRKVTSDYSAVLFVRTSNAGPAPYPIKELVSYTRFAAIAPGRVASANLNITLGALARRDEQGNSILYPGKYEFLLDVPTQATLSFTLTGKQVVLDLWPQPPANQTYEAAINCPDYGNCPQLGQPVA
nr:hypothetical protein B0A51_05827 [Rachicladosporium sp. CCFEE 5018]